MADRNVPRPPSTGWGNLSKTLAFWALIAVLFIALFQYMGKQRSPSELPAKGGESCSASCSATQKLN